MRSRGDWDPVTADLMITRDIIGVDCIKALRTMVEVSYGIMNVVDQPLCVGKTSESDGGEESIAMCRHAFRVTSVLAVDADVLNWNSRIPQSGTGLGRQVTTVQHNALSL